MSRETRSATRADLGGMFAGQVQLLSQSGRVTLLLVAIVGVLLLLELLAEIGIAFMPGVPQPFDWPRVFGSFDLLGWVAFGWGIAIWSGEPPSLRDTHWSMPVSVVGHDLLRIAAGWMCMMLAVVVLAAVGSGLAYASGGWRHIQNAPLAVWAAFLVHASLMFGVGSAIGLAAQRPVRVALIGVLAFVALTLVERGLGVSALSPSRLLVGSFGLLTAGKGGFREAFDPQYHLAAPWWLLSSIWAAIIVSLLPLASRLGIRHAGGERGVRALWRTL
jgi:hypothetical protein